MTPKRSIIVAWPNAWLIVWLALASCGGTQAQGPPPAPAPEPAATAAPPPAPAVPTENVSLRDVGLDPEKMDTTANPCDDFYRFACGGFVAKTEIPSDEPSWGSFNMLAERNRNTLHDILEIAARAPGDDPATQKLGTFYASCMDEAAVEKAGTRALDPLRATVRKVKDVRSLAAAVATLHKAGVPVLFRVRDSQDSKDATKIILEVIQGGLGMPDRDYYLKDDEHTKAVRTEYLAHAERMLVLLGRKPAAAKQAAADVLALETELARSQRPRTELRDAEKSYNRLDRSGLEKSLPSMAWSSFFTTVGFPDVQEVTVTSPGYVEALEGILKAHKPAQWQAYLDLHVGRAFAPALPKRFADEAFAWQKVISGQKEQKVRWKRCVEATDRMLGELLGQPYVKVAFAGDSKDAALMLVKEITRAFRENLASISWMDDATKAKAIEKSKQLEYLIGYPDSWRTYDFAVDRKDYAKNVVTASAFDIHYRLSKIGKPLDKKLWQMTPPTVNAYYDPSLNEMVFPAGILQPPFYSVKASIPVNLGGMGMVVGHELTHGYDDQGAKFDGAGNMSGWWPPAVNQQFHERTQCVVDYYSRYEAAPGLFENGELTQGENIADLGGVKQAFRAYQNLRKDAPTRQVADAFTEDQQFFLSVGQAWCAKAAPEYERLIIATNPHALPRFRVNGSLSNLPAFAATWKCPAESKMSPKDRCEVW